MRVIGSSALVVLFVASACSHHRPTRNDGSAALSPNLAAAVTAANIDGKPVLALISDEGDSATIDCGVWLREDPALRPLLARLHTTIVWNLSPDLATCIAVPSSGLMAINAAGKPIVIESVPLKRAQLVSLLTDILDHSESLDDGFAAAMAGTARSASITRTIQRLEHAGRADQASALIAKTGGAGIEPARREELLVMGRFHAAHRWSRLARALSGKSAMTPTTDWLMSQVEAAESPLLDESGEALRPFLTAARAAIKNGEHVPLASLPTLPAMLEQAIKAQRLKAVEGIAPLLAARPGSASLAAWAGVSLFESVEKDPKAEATARAMTEALLAKPLPEDERLRSLEFLDYATIELGYADARRLADIVVAESPRGRNAADTLLDLADRAFNAGDPAEAQRLWALAATASGEGESPSLHRTALAMAAQARAAGASDASPWARRQVLDAVALVPDLPTFAAAIACWSDRAFFPVLMQDDLYAPKFISAFKPARVVIVPSVQREGSAALAPEQAMRAVLASWTSDDAHLPAAADRSAALARLRELGITPPGVVFTDWTSGELAGGLALAAGRFQGLETLSPPPVGAERRPGGLDSYVSRDDARAWAAHIHRLIAEWGTLGDAQSTATLAGAYPFRYFGQPAGNNTYCTDDLLGRDDEGIRVAVIGRLAGDAARSAYQAACSLFLQPESALLFNTYEPTSKTVWGSYRMTAAADRLRTRVTVDLAQGGKDADIEAFRARVSPWNRHPLFLVNSSGYPTAWSITGGDGTTDDFPIGEPYAMHIVHSGSAAEPYDSDTLAGRALWGGAFVYVGSVSEPYLTAFQRPDHIAPRVAAGAPFISACRRRIGQSAAGPWRLIAFGDPLFCLRQHTANRVPGAEHLVDAAEIPLVVSSARATCTRETYGEWLSQLRTARWLGDRGAAIALVRAVDDPALLDARGLGMALEECVIADAGAEAAALWAGADATARTDYAARVYARASVARAMDVALTADDTAALIASCDRLLTTSPPENFVARWLGKIEASATRGKSLPFFRTWLTQRVADDGSLAWRKPLSTTLARTIADQLTLKDAWTDEDRADALSALAFFPFAADDPQPFTQFATQLIEACAAKGLAGLDDFLTKARARMPADGPQRAGIDQARADLDRRRTFFKDWLILGPLAADAPEARWGAVAPDGKVALSDAWKRPFMSTAYGNIDLIALFGQQQSVCAYAACTLEADADVDGFLLLGSDDGVTAWLDGTEIWRNPAMRGVIPDQDQVPVKATKGRHTLVLRIDQGGGGWGFCARVSADRTGAPLPGVRLRCPERASVDAR